MTDSNRLAITEFATGSDGVATGNEMIAKLEAGAGLWACKQVLLNTPPGSPAEGDLYIVGTAGTGAWVGQDEKKALYYNAAWLLVPAIEGELAYDQTANTYHKYDGADWVTVTLGGGSATESLIIAVSDETTALIVGTAQTTFRMPYAFTLSDARASLTTAQASGTIFTVDINKNGTSILSTKLTIDNTEKTSTTAATAAVISDTSLADDAEMKIDIDQIGDGTAAGLKVYLIGIQT